MYSRKYNAKPLLISNLELSPLNCQNRIRLASSNTLPDFNHLRAPEPGGPVFFYQSVLEFEDFTIGCRPTHPDVTVVMIEVLGSSPGRE